MQIRSYSKKELALAYAPELSVASAVNRLASWIRLNAGLSHALERTGYRRTQRAFTPRQVGLIFRFLGEP